MDGKFTFTWNDDVLMELLLWLPAISLVRFKLVCKHWLSIISSHHFCLLHTLRHHKPQPSFIFHPHTISPSQFFYFHPLSSERLVPYHFTVPIPNTKILSSCNGLLLLESDQPGKSCYIHNPTTKKSRCINLTVGGTHTDLLGLNLAFDPSKSPHYKIICIRKAAARQPAPRRQPYSRDGLSCQIEVYDSEIHTWKLSLESFTAYRETKFSFGVHWGNAIHWDNHPRAHMYFDISKNVIGSLPYAQIPWPPGGGGGACHCQLQESNGRLHHFIIVSDRGDKSIAVLELQEDYSQWQLKYHDKFGRLPGKTRTLCFVRGDEREVDTMVYHVPGKMVVYKFIDKSSKEVDLTNEAFYKYDSVLFEPQNIHLFGESLVPV
ncbi:F-box protein At5g07610-like [Andrographis paniculata]|uniref:F-box protein At5g07610-like n=1 Tax=Andrographis paniculata TaxID=175694 RepID=UPI0021E88E3F|nr:F-box protein At5g07610-like [Andrographis paniculata]